MNIETLNTPKQIDSDLITARQNLEVISNVVLSNNKGNIITGLRKEWIEIRVRLNIIVITLMALKKPWEALSVLIQLDKFRRKILGKSRIVKMSYANKKYYWDLYTPGWPSQAFNQYIYSEVGRISPVKKAYNRFTNALVAVTKKCTLQCEHCFEWDALNDEEKLTLADLKTIVNKLQNKGIAQIQLSGGEPLLRTNDIIEILNSSRTATEFWILTSGYGLSAKNALELKNAGLTGLFVSLVPPIL